MKLPSFLDICDTTDQRFNTEELELPTGVTSTDELMAEQGLWLPVTAATELLLALREHIVSHTIRFGLLSNQYAQVVAELDEVIAFMQSAAGQAEKFNFSVVM